MFLLLGHQDFPRSVRRRKAVFSKVLIFFPFSLSPPPLRLNFFLSFKPAGHMERWDGHWDESQKSWMWVLPEPLISCVVLGKLLHLGGPLGHLLHNDEAWLKGRSPTASNTQVVYLWSLDNSLCLYSSAGTSYFLLTGKRSELQPERVQTSAKRNVVLKRHQYLIAEL